MLTKQFIKSLNSLTEEIGANALTYGFLAAIILALAIINIYF